MKISYNWLKEYVDINVPAEELALAFSMLGLEVEETIDYGKKFYGFITAKIIKKEKHPDADKLSVCTVAYNGTEQQVVCGAPNAAEGQVVVLGLSGAVVPAGGFALAKRKIRGIESDGMICSQAELGLGEDSSGIWVLPENTETGITLADHVGLNDVIFDLSITPNKAECLSYIGIAREVAAKYGLELKKPAIMPTAASGDINSLIKIGIENADACPRYTAKAVTGARIGESPEWLKNKLAASGLRPINAAVDVTNYILLEYGQPLHAFDLATLRGRRVIIKNAEEGAKFTTLDGKERTLKSNMLMICDGEGPVAVAGVMGGQNSEITENTCDILIESAFFNASSVRKTSKTLGINSDASYRYERGTDIEITADAAEKAAAMIASLTGGTVANGIIDIYPEQKKRISVNLRYERVRALTGENISDDETDSILSAIGFVKENGNTDSALWAVPSWRHDVNGEADLIEDVLRFYGYDKLNSDFNAAVDFDSHSVPANLARPVLRARVRHYLTMNGFTEIMTQNQTAPHLAAVFTENPVRLANPLGEELSVMRPSMIPAMLKVAAHNINHGNKDLHLYETGKIFLKNPGSGHDFINGYTEEERLLLCLGGMSRPLFWQGGKGYDFYDIKGIFEQMARDFNLVSYALRQGHQEDPVFSKNSLDIFAGKTFIGKLGQVKSRYLKHFGIEEDMFILELNLSELYRMDLTKPPYRKVGLFPSVTRDLAFLADKKTKAGEIRQSIIDNGTVLLKEVTVFDVYEGQALGDSKKSLGYSLRFAAEDKTLTDKEIDDIITNIISKLESKFTVELRKS